MSLDRQRLLNELGSVMNQLQSADCGCMGKLFSNQNQGHGSAMGSALPTCGGCRRGGCQGHGYPQSTAGAGEPYSMGYNMNHSMGSNMNHSMNHCMGHCNPPKLYADTYSYLNNNLMQPVVKEVYDDLKSISPANTIMNNPLANQMGLAQGSPSPLHQGISGNMGNTMQNMSGMENGNMSTSRSQPPTSAIGGMGPQIVNMIMGDSGNKPSNQGTPGQGGQPTGLMGNPQFTLGQTGSVPASMHAGENQGGNTGAFTNLAPQFANPPTQYVTQSNMYDNMANNTPSQAIPQMGNINSVTPQIRNSSMTPGNQLMDSANPGTGKTAAANQQYGQHTQGMMKFNEMFPGVMQGGDLGFDPMAIAIQMNPANQQKAAMDTMQKMMTGGRQMDTAGNASAMNPDVTKSAVDGISNRVTSALGQQQLPQSPPQSTNQQIISSGEQQIMNRNSESIPSQPFSVPKQQILTAITEQPMHGQQQLQHQQQIKSYQQLPNQPTIDPNTGALLDPASLTSGYEGMADPNSTLASHEIPQTVFKEPIFPADISRNKPMTYSKPQQGRNEYNTLGQPVQMIPAGIFHRPEPNLPQTLSPQPQTTKSRHNDMRYSNVKSTISKTSLAGNRPVGRTPSRNQLQHIYNQYKGSQSFTQQNTKPSVQGGTFSEGKLNISSVNAHPTRQVPVERVGGDTAANNQVPPSQLSNQVGQVGDVLVSDKPLDDGNLIKAPLSPIPKRQAKLRNGLQDVVYTSYPSSAAWSFHGNQTYRPLFAGNRYRSFK